MRGSESSPSIIAPISSRRVSATRSWWYFRPRCSGMSALLPLCQGGLQKRNKRLRISDRRPQKQVRPALHRKRRRPHAQTKPGGLARAACVQNMLTLHLSRTTDQNPKRGHAMKAAVVQAYSEPPRYTDFEEPTPGAHELLIHVTAAGLHPIVRALAGGKHYGSTGKFPFVAGVDGVGRRDDGTRVFFGAARFPFGTFAERAIAAPDRCLPISDGVDDVSVAAMMNPGMSAWAALVARAQMKAGENVLILGATGSAGHMAVQIARRLGAGRIVVAGRNPQALDQLRSIGADASIALTQEREALVTAFRDEICGQHIDLILDYLWGEPAE